MSDAEKSTPRPWSAHGSFVWGPMGRELAVYEGEDGSVDASLAEDRANAALAVRAVNSFDALVVALKTAGEVVAALVMGAYSQGLPVPPKLNAAADQIEAALKLVEAP